jgi:hypothetical protein
MRRTTLHRILFVFLILASCGKSTPQIDGFDVTSWKNDKHGCAGKRDKMSTALLSQKDKFLALSELEIIDLLGKPDEQELYKRNQKFYYYFVKPSPDCNPSGSNASLRLVIRFNAMGLAKEVVIEGT